MASGNGFHQRAPERTTPQWSAEPSVQRGHEGTDADLIAVSSWLAITAIVATVGMGVIYAVFITWAQRGTSAGEQARPHAPSPVFAAKWMPPPPRILPNPIDLGKNPRITAPNHPEQVPEWRIQEEQESTRLGLLDPRTGQPALPDQAAAAVLRSMNGPPAASGAPAAPPGAIPGRSAAVPEMQQPMPGASSGGTVPEDQVAGER
jgi:hypothetical protein